MTEAIKYISRFNSESPLPGVLELYAQSFLSSALRELFGMGILKAADGWLWWSGSIQVALMPLAATSSTTTTTHNNNSSAGRNAATPTSSSTPSTREPSTVVEVDGGSTDLPPSSSVPPTSSLRSRAATTMKGVGGLLGRLLLAFLQYSDVAISRGATTFRDEVVGVTWLLIERSHLQTYSSSMAENFFGMKRAGVVRIGDGVGGGGPSSLRKALSLIAGVGGGSDASVSANNSNSTLTPQQQDHDCNKVFGSDVVFVDPMAVAATAASTSPAGSMKPKSASLLMSGNQYLICLLQLGVAPYLLTKLTNYYKYYTSDNPDVIDERMEVVRGYLGQLSAAKADEQSLIEANSTPARALNGATNGGGIIVESSDILARVRANKRRAVLWAKIKFIIYRTAVKVLVTLFPLVNMANQGLRAFFLTAYALERTPYFTVLQRVAQVGIRRVQMQDRMLQAGASKAAAGASSSSLQRFFVKAGAVAVPLMFLIVRYQGWRRDQQNTGAAGGGDGGGIEGGDDDDGAGGRSEEGDLRKIPPPPEATSTTTIASGGGSVGGGGASASSPLPTNTAESTTTGEGVVGEGGGGVAKRGTCPVCTNPTTNPAVLIVSGVVGCFTCLHSYTTDHKKCPSTGIPCTTVHVRRLYE